MINQLATHQKIPAQRWWRIIPILILVNIVSYIDRINISFAITGGMSEDLAMSASTSGLIAGIFFVGYMILQVPGGHIAERGNAKKFIAGSLLCYGLITILTAFVQDYTQLLVMRFLLGLAEGGVWPAIYAIISHWFPAAETGRASAFFVSNAAIGSIIAGPLSGFILAYYDWHMLFIVQGTITVLLIFIWWPQVCNRPNEAKWISPAEKEYLMTTITAEQKALAEKNAGKNFSYKALLTDNNMWKLVIIYFCYQVGNYGYIMWLPTIVKEITKKSMDILGLLNAIPFVIALIGLYVFGALSDKSCNRRKYTIITILGFAVSLILSTLFKENVWLSFSLLVCCGFFFKPIVSLFWTMPPLLFPAEVLGGARGIINAIGNLGGALGPFMVGWVITYTNNYNIGIYLLSFFLILGAVFTAIMPQVTADPFAREYVVKSKDSTV